jgi:hypothetical protein
MVDICISALFYSLHISIKLKSNANWYEAFNKRNTRMLTCKAISGGSSVSSFFYRNYEPDWVLQL